MRMRGLATVRGLITRVRVAPSPEVPGVRRSRPAETSAPLARPRLVDHATPFVQLERDVWDRFRPQLRAAVEAELATLAMAEAMQARPVCCGQPMRRHDQRPVHWLTWVGRVRAVIHAMTIWRAVQRLGEAAAHHTEVLGAYHADPRKPRARGRRGAAGRRRCRGWLHAGNAGPSHAPTPARRGAAK